MAPPTKFRIMNLPVETQKEIFSFVRKRDLLVAQRASKDLHALASARLYHDLKFTFIFPAADANANAVNQNKPEFRLPEALHTFLTSEHDYAQYARSFSLLLPQQQTEENSRKAVSRYHVEEEANKLLNTMLLVMLRKAKKLESFTWDPSIELSGQVYQALSKIPSLQQLYIRLDNKAIQRISSVSVTPGTAVAANAPLFGNPTSTAPTVGSNVQTIVVKNSAQLQTRAVKSRHFSDFKSLRHLEILGMDDLGSNLEQIAACLAASSGTLRSITFSLSQDLARRARKPVPKPAPQNPELGEDSPDDDATVSEAAPTPAPAASSNDAEARKEKAVQDSVLAVLFGLEKRKKKAKNVDKALDTAASRMLSIYDTQNAFVEIISQIKKNLIERPTDPIGTEASQDLHEILDKVIASYIGANRRSLAAKTSVLKPNKPSATGKPKKTSTVTQSPFGMLPAQFSNMTNEDLALWAHQNSHLLGEDYLDFSVNGPLPSLAVPSSSSSYIPTTSNPFTTSFGASTHTLPHHLPTSSKPASMASSPYTYGPYTSSVGPSNSSSYLPDHQMQMILLEQQQKKHHKILLNKQKKDLQLAEFQKQKAQMEEYAASHGIGVGNTTMSESEDSGTQSETEDEIPVLDETVFFPAAEDEPKDKDDGLDIDMEHPDVIPSVENDSDPDQEIVDDMDYDSAELSDLWTETSSKGKGKGKEILKNRSISPAKKGKSPANGHPVSSKAPVRGKGKKALKSKVEKKMDEDDMQEYLRTTHGFHLEDFSLYLVPIKASIMAKALDLSFLKRLSLLGVGPQGGFWTLMGKIHAEAGTIRLQSIQTDDVSMAFLHAVSTFPPLENLYLMKRGSKDTDFSSTKNPGAIDDIKVFALRRHLVSLKRLVINNQDSTTWDLNDSTVRLICGSGYKLIELGVSMAMDQYHTLLQTLPGLTSLHALHIITLRTADQCHTAARENRRFTLDTFGHCPTLKIKYLVLNSQVLELYRRGHRRGGFFGVSGRVPVMNANNKPPSSASPAPKDGKQLNKDSSSLLEDFKKMLPMGSDFIMEKVAEIEARTDKTPTADRGETEARKRLHDEFLRKGNEMAVAKTLKFWDVDGVEMFRKRIRVGRL